jgi:hypothetical protein
VAGRVRDLDPAVHGHVGVAAEDQPVGELRDGDGGTGAPETGDLRRKIAVGIGPGGGGTVVDAEAEVLVDAVLDEEGAPQAGDDALPIALPADRRGRAVGAGEGIGGTAGASLCANSLRPKSASPIPD